MADVYKRLAQKLDELPNGFPETDEGVELKILQKIFTPEEAEMALKIRPVPETVEEIAERLEKPVDEMQTILDDMVLKGQIGSFKEGGKQMYKFFPFAIGIYEFQFLRKDKTPEERREYMDLFEEYAPYLGISLVGIEPAVTRVVPVSTEIDEDLHVHRYEDVRSMIREAKSFMLQDCMCRTEQGLLGNRCKYPLDVCLNFSNEDDAYERYPQLGKVISQEEAFEVIRRAEEAGLVHLTYNWGEGHDFICNCCSCCCGMLRAVKEFNIPNAIAKSNFIAAIDHEACTACGVCKDDRCQMDAIVEEDDVYSVLSERCIGCGACVSTCPVEAITLERKPEAEHDIPPANSMEWNKKRAAARGIKLKLD
jgi:ferredoxin